MGAAKGCIVVPRNNSSAGNALDQKSAPGTFLFNAKQFSERA
jgi:hypothetical protein